MKQILVVDNEAYIREVTKMSLELVGHWSVITASSGTQAIALAAQHHPDAILLDVMMPDMDGPTTFQQLQANPQTQAIPVILLTAQLHPDDRQAYSAIGIHHLIAKPFDPLKLAQQVSQLLSWPEP